VARRTEWQRDIDDGIRKENWSLTGPNRIVKVVPLTMGPATSLGGYITVGRFLINKTPREIERDLGLNQNFLLSGARIYRFTRLPMTHEYDYELTALHPGGLAFNPAHSDPSYPPGSPVIHQWRIKPGVMIPVDGNRVLDLRPQDRFPYDWLI